MKIALLFLTLVAVALPAPARAAETVAAQKTVTITDMETMAEVDFLRGAVAKFATYINQCMGAKPDYISMNRCLCAAKSDFKAAWYGIGGLIARHPDFNGARLEYKPPGTEEPVIVDLRQYVLILRPYAAYVCK